MLLAACTPGPGSTPAESPFGDNPPADLAQIPQSVLAQVDLGEAGPGISGSGGSFSYDSDLGPETTLRAYADQLVRAGFRYVATVDVWQVFVGPRLTVWIQAASGPPTSLLVVVRPTGAADVIRPYPRPTESVPRDVAGGVAGNPNPASRPVPVRRPDPPHAGAPLPGAPAGRPAEQWPVVTTAGRAPAAARAAGPARVQDRAMARQVAPVPGAAEAAAAAGTTAGTAGAARAHDPAPPPAARRR